MVPRCVLVLKPWSSVHIELTAEIQAGVVHVSNVLNDFPSFYMTDLQSADPRAVTKLNRKYQVQLKSTKQHCA